MGRGGSSPLQRTLRADHGVGAGLAAPPLDKRQDATRVGRVGRLRGIATVVACVLVSAAAASSGLADTGPPVDGPDLSQMTLQAGDFASGGSVANGQWLPVDSLPTYLAVNGPGRVGSTSLFLSLTLATAQTDAAAAAADVVDVRSALATKDGRAAFVKAFV